MAVAALPRVYALSMRELYAQVIADVRDGKAGTIHPELYRAYSESLRKAVSGFAPPAHSSSPSYKSYQDLQAQFEANLSRFAAYKAWHATRQLERQLADPDGVQRTPEQFDRMARAVLNTFNRYQAAEYNTAVARARTAHQWQQFSQGDNMFLFPNLRWLPSRSANPREEHMPFYNLVLPKNHTFWTHNQPGNLWNCKCDWEETDDPIDLRKLTPDQLADFSTAQGAIHARGLEGNPAQTGQIFTDECTYIKKANADTPTEIIRAVRDFNRELYKDIDLHFDTNIGKVWVDEITIKEVTKGAKTDESYFLKQEIARHFDLYASQLQPILPDEDIDLSHNNPESEFYKRKEQFCKMKVFKLTIIRQDQKGNKTTFDFQVKLGQYDNSGKLNLYSITEPW